jgi:O-antigen ligase
MLSININYNKISLFFLLIFPIAIITGSFLVNFLSILLAILFIIYISTYKNIKLFEDKTLLLLLIIFFSFMTSSLFSNYQSKSAIKTLSFIRILLFFLCIYYLILKDKEESLLKLSKVVFFLTLFISSDLWVQYYIGENILGYPKQQANRLTSIFGNEQIPGSIIFKFLPFVIYYLLQLSKKNFLSRFKYLIFLFIYFSILITGERASTIVVTLFLFLMIIFNFRIINKKKFLIYFIIFIAIFYYLYANQNSVIKERISYTVDHQLHNNVYKTLFKNALDGFYKNPILGSGVQTYRYECPKYSHSCSTHPHNYILELLSDVGIIGCLVFLIFLIGAVYKKLKELKKNSFLKIFIVTYSFSLFLPFIPTGSIFSSFSFSISLFSLGFLLAINTKKFTY